MTSTCCIELLVNSDRCVSISDIERFPDNSGFVGNISVRSGAFALHNHRFFFDGLGSFLEDAKQIYATLNGKCDLRAEYERNYLSLSMAGRGHVQVTGHFEFFDGESQRLEFGFMTDQSFLPPFIRSLEEVCRELKI